MKNTTILDCTSCMSFGIVKAQCKCAVDKNIDGNFTEYKDKCYKPNIAIMRAAASDLLNMRYDNSNSKRSIGASILLDLYAGISEEMIKQKYADVYGHVGHEQSGYKKICLSALDALPYTESSAAFRKWFDNYEKEKMRILASKAAQTNSNRKKMLSSIVDKNSRIMSIGTEEYFVLENVNNNMLVIPLNPGIKTAWGLRTNQYNSSLVKHLLETYTAGNEYLASVIRSKPRLMSPAEFQCYSEVLPVWDCPFWLDTIVDDTSIFVLAADGKNVIPISCHSKDVYLRPILQVKIA